MNNCIIFLSLPHLHHFCCWLVSHFSSLSWTTAWSDPLVSGVIPYDSMVLFFCGTTGVVDRCHDIVDCCQQLDTVTYPWLRLILILWTILFTFSSGQQVIVISKTPNLNCSDCSYGPFSCTVYVWTIIDSIHINVTNSGEISNSSHEANLSHLRNASVGLAAEPLWGPENPSCSGPWHDTKWRCNLANQHVTCWFMLMSRSRHTVMCRVQCECVCKCPFPHVLSSTSCSANCCPAMLLWAC